MNMFDSTLKWHQATLFGRGVHANVTVSNQTLLICEQPICFPARFNERIKWFDGQVRHTVFNLEEAWDHQNETNPSTSFPRNAGGILHTAFDGYVAAMNLHNGIRRTVVHIVRRHKQILIQNMGYFIDSNGNRQTTDIPVKVFFPPTSLDLQRQTNGTVESDGVVLSAGQYVLFYPSDESPQPISTTHGLFTNSPAGVNKTKTHELQIQGYRERFIGVDIPTFFTGIPIRSNTKTTILSTPRIIFHSERIATYNASGILDSSLTIWLRTNDPYHSGNRIYNNISFTTNIAYALDDNNTPKYILFGTITYKHNSRYQLQSENSVSYIYDLENNEGYLLGWINPTTSFTSSGRSTSNDAPHLRYPIQPAFNIGNTSRVIIVLQDDTYVVRTNQNSENLDGYGFCMVYSDRAICFEFLGFYTDDDITINPKQMGMNRFLGAVINQILPYGDRTLSAGKTYFVMARIWEDTADLTDEQYADKIRALQPKVLSSTEWTNAFTDLPPYSIKYRIIPDTARYLSYTYNKKVTAGQPTTISGQVTSLVGETHANKRVNVLLVRNNQIVAQAQTTTDSDGNFSVTITPPETGEYRLVIVVNE